MEIIKRIEIARGFGDLSENSEYDDAKREQQENEAEKHRIEEILKNYVLIDETDLNTDTVRLGQCVTLYDYDFEEEVEYYLVGSTEADPIAGKISNESPVGQAILGKKVDDIVEVETLDGVVKYKIVKIRIPDKKA
jgi:transcription elongation factor greA